MNPPQYPKIRVRYAKVGKVRFTSHRDMARIWERNLRKIGFPVAYSEGFSPRPKLSFGLALPTGAESSSEYFEITAQLDWDQTELDELPTKLNTVLPVGVSVVAAAMVPPGSASLQAAVVASTWEITLPNATVAAAQAWAAEVVAASELVVDRERKGKTVTDDVRPQIISLTATDLGGTPGLTAELGTIGRALRPAELLTVIKPHQVAGLMRRTHQWIETDGARSEPLATEAAVGQRVPVGAP